VNQYQTVDSKNSWHDVNRRFVYISSDHRRRRRPADENIGLHYK